MTTLGYTPNKAALIVTWGADWVCAITEQGGTWPEGTLCRLRVNSTDYSATVDAAEATAAFRVESEICDLWDNGSEYTVYLIFPDTPTLEYGWFTGRVKRQDGATA